MNYLDERRTPEEQAAMEAEARSGWQVAGGDKQ